MAVELRLRNVGFTELEILVLAHQGACKRAVAVLHLRGRSKDRRIKISDAFRAADRHIELDVRNSEPDPAEARRVRLIDTHAITPRADRLDVIVVLGKTEFGAVEFSRDGRQTIEQRL